MHHLSRTLMDSVIMLQLKDKMLHVTSWTEHKLSRLLEAF